MKALLAVASTAEALTGLVLGYPPIAVKLLFGADITGAGVVMSRIAGISLISLGVACLPQREDRPGDGAARAFAGMLVYSTLAALYLTYLGIGGNWTGMLLWPAVLVHTILTACLCYARFNQRRTMEARP